MALVERFKTALKNTPRFTRLFSRNGHIWVDIGIKACGQRVRRSLQLLEIHANWTEARTLQIQIEADIEAGLFDISLDKYLPKKISVSSPELSLSELWDKYIEFKKKFWSPTTYANSGLVFAKKFKTLHNQDLRSPEKIKRELLDRYSVDVARRSCQQINAAVKWGLEEKLISNIDWDISQRDFRFLKGNREDVDINPFSVEERDAILLAFETNQFARKPEKNSHSQYYPAIKFWFLTGCRTGELFGLQWMDVYSKYILFSHQKKSVCGKPASLNGGMEANRRVLTRSHVDNSSILR